MRRLCIITINSECSIELTKIAAVTRLVTRPFRSMNAHETTQMSLIGSVNQLYAEVGANPRDNNSNTEKGRGYTVDKVKQLLRDAEYEIFFQQVKMPAVVV